MNLGDIPKRSFPSSEEEGALLEGAFNPRCFLLDLQSFLAAFCAMSVLVGKINAKAFAFLCDPCLRRDKFSHGTSTYRIF